MTLLIFLSVVQFVLDFGYTLERGKVIAHLIVAVHSVIDGDKANAQFWKADFKDLDIPQKPLQPLQHQLFNSRLLNEVCGTLIRVQTVGGAAEVRTLSDVAFECVVVSLNEQN